MPTDIGSSVGSAFVCRDQGCGFEPRPSTPAMLRRISIAHTRRPLRGMLNGEHCVSRLECKVRCPPDGLNYLESCLACGVACGQLLGFPIKRATNLIAIKRTLLNRGRTKNFFCFFFLYFVWHDNLANCGSCRRGGTTNRLGGGGEGRDEGKG